MKRFLCILLTAFMLLLLSACASNQAASQTADSVLDSASTLMEEGKYQQAYDLLTSQESYLSYQQQIDRAVAGMQKVQGTFLLDTVWKDIGSGLELTFLEGGVLRFGGTGAEEADAMWSYENGVLKVSRIAGLEGQNADFPAFSVAIEETNDIFHLTIYDFDFIREEDYALHGPVPVAITTDNWQDYFEIREEYMYGYDENKVCNYVCIMKFLCLKEEYVHRARMDSSSVYLAYSYDEVSKELNPDDLKNKIITIGETMETLNEKVAVCSKLGLGFGDEELLENTYDMDAVLYMHKGYMDHTDPDHVITTDNLNVWYVDGSLMLLPE